MFIKRLLFCLLLAATPALAAPPAPAAPVARHPGYAFDSPRLLTRQRMFGLYHGVTVLATACPDPGIRAAYDAWAQRQHDAIAATLGELAQYHFGAPSIDARALAHLFNLPEKPAAAPGSEELKAACASLPQALTAPRYDLAQLFLLTEAMTRISLDVEIEQGMADCRALLGAGPRDDLNRRYAAWRAENDAVRDQAAQWLAEKWPADAAEKTYAAWFAALKKQRHPKPGKEQCERFFNALTQAKTALAQAFALPPRSHVPHE